jgi:hypothetical protein
MASRPSFYIQNNSNNSNLLGSHAFTQVRNQGKKAGKNATKHGQGGKIEKKFRTPPSIHFLDLFSFVASTPINTNLT